MTTLAQNGGHPCGRASLLFRIGRPARRLRAPVAARRPPDLRRVKLREMRSDNFLGRITFDALCAQVPVGDNAFRAQHVNRVVGHALHQQPELLLALPERFVGDFALCQVARDLGKPNEFAGRHADRIDDHVGPEPRAVLADPPAFAHEPAFTRGGLKRQGRDSGLLSSSV